MRPFGFFARNSGVRVAPLKMSSLHTAVRLLQLRQQQANLVAVAGVEVVVQRCHAPSIRRRSATACPEKHLTIV